MLYLIDPSVVRAADDCHCGQDRNMLFWEKQKSYFEILLIFHLLAFLICGICTRGKELTVEQSICSHLNELSSGFQAKSVSRKHGGWKQVTGGYTPNPPL